VSRGEEGGGIQRVEEDARGGKRGVTCDDRKIKCLEVISVEVMTSRHHRLWLGTVPTDCF